MYFNIKNYLKNNHNHTITLIYSTPPNTQLSSKIYIIPRYGKPWVSLNITSKLVRREYTQAQWTSFLSFLHTLTLNFHKLLFYINFTSPIFTNLNIKRSLFPRDNLFIR